MDKNMVLSDKIGVLINFFKETLKPFKDNILSNIKNTEVEDNDTKKEIDMELQILIVKIEENLDNFQQEVDSILEL